MRGRRPPRMALAGIATLTLWAISTLPTVHPTALAMAGQRTAYELPLAGPLVVVHIFTAPPTPYAAGHRGVDLAAHQGDVVHAAGAGRVSFAGEVAGRGVVVIVHPDGISTEYEPLLISVRTGEMTSAGQPIGHLAGTHDGCGQTGCLHWGARRDGVYFDPMSLLRPLGVVRLLPWS